MTCVGIAHILVLAMLKISQTTDMQQTAEQRYNVAFYEFQRPTTWTFCATLYKMETSDEHYIRLEATENMIS